MLVLLTFKEYAKATLFWIEKQNSVVIFVVLVALFTVVSFPVVVGYLLLIISSGYLLGMTTGLLAVILGANLGVFIAHNVIKLFHGLYPVHRYVNWLTPELAIHFMLFFLCAGLSRTRLDVRYCVSFRARDNLKLCSFVD